MNDTIDADPPRLREALKRVAVILKETGIPFALAGGYAVWARGGPEPDHDVDFAIAEADAATAAEALRERGLDVVDPPEDWLFKAYVEGAMVDLLFRTNSEPISRGDLDGVEEIEVESVLMPVLPATEVMAQKLNALEEHACDFGRLLPVARAVREQVDWVEVRAATAENPFAVAFLVLLEQLQIFDPSEHGVDQAVTGTSAP
jgi:hypothetical protein